MTALSYWQTWNASMDSSFLIADASRLCHSSCRHEPTQTAEDDTIYRGGQTASQSKRDTLNIVRTRP
jgi:hypothetical protein